jgi:type IV secretion system protein VirB9
MKLLALAMLITVAEASAVAEDVRFGSAPGIASTAYKLSGNRTLLPSSIHDDGVRTYIQWSQAQAMPAVFGIDEQGREQLVNGFMRDGAFTIDRVYGRLIFRIDGAQASARRTMVRKT